MLLRAIFLGTLEETQWAFGTGPQIFHPDLWAKFTNLLPTTHKQNPIQAFGTLLENPDPSVHLAAAEAWSQFERGLSSLENFLGWKLLLCAFKLDLDFQLVS